MSPPTVAIVGATGFVGNFLTQSFLEAKNEGKFREVRVLTSKKGDKTKEFEEKGATVQEVNFQRKETLLNALKSVDVVVSAMGTGPGSSDSRIVLLEAMVQCGVDVYFPSEFGTNHYSSRLKIHAAAFEAKKAHFQEASVKTGLKTIRILCNMIMEYTFGKWCGLDCQTGVWKIPGSGDTPLALSASRDIGRFTVEAALLALKSPDTVPDALELVSDTRTLKEYAEAFDKVSGKKTKLQQLSLTDALAKYEKSGDFYSAFPLMFETGAFDVTTEAAGGNKLLNPNENVWQLKKIEEYAEETGGIPAI